MIASFIFMSRISNNLFSKMLKSKISSLDTAIVLSCFAKANSFTTASIPKYTSPIWAPHLRINGNVLPKLCFFNFPDMLFSLNNL